MALKINIETPHGLTIAGFRLGHPELHPDRGEIKVVQASASIEIKDQQEDANKTRPA